ncbi:MAG: type II secretion system F family protein [Actinobacteria bacterium]|nr:type II secretion system F family protein [Actinomycetota bacterium]MBE3122378.1 type II secretion system F family protein [Thermoplasmata archaeon]
MKSSKYSNFCLWKFDRFFSIKTKQRFQEKNITLKQADINMLYQEYFSMFLMTMLLGFILTIIPSLLLYLFFSSTNTLLLAILLLTLVPLSIWGMCQYIPHSYIKKRAANIDRFLPYAVNFISTMAIAGVSPADIFRSFSTIDIYGEVQKEAEKIIKELDVMGIDTITVLKHSLENTPSKKFKSFLQGIIGAIQSGSDLHIYLTTIVDQYMADEFLARKKNLDTLGVLAETFVTTLIAFPIFLVIIISVMGFFGGSSSFTIEILFIFSFLVLPLAYGGYYALIRSTSIEEIRNPHSKKKRSVKEFYKKNRSFILILLLSTSLLLSFYCIIYVFSYYKYVNFTTYFFFDIFFLSVLVLIGPVTFYCHKQAQKQRELERRLPDFVVEMGNCISSGMTVFDAIKIASKGHYGNLTPEIQKMKAELSWHMPVTKVFDNFADRMRSAIIKRIVVSINTGLIMGGMTSKVFMAAAKEIKQINNIEEQRKSEMSTYTTVIIMSFFVFLGIIMVLNNTLFASFFKSQKSTVEMAGVMMNTIDPMALKYALCSFVFVQGIGAGMIGGFMMDGKLSSGLRYSFVLGVISLFVFKFLF